MNLTFDDVIRSMGGFDESQISDVLDWLEDYKKDRKQDELNCIFRKLDKKDIQILKEYLLEDKDECYELLDMALQGL